MILLAKHQRQRPQSAATTTREYQRRTTAKHRQLAATSTNNHHRRQSAISRNSSGNDSEQYRPDPIMASTLTNTSRHKKAVLSQGTTARCRALAQKACTYSPRAMQRIERTPKLSTNMRTLSKNPLYKCTNEGLMHVAAWYHGTVGPKFTKLRE